MTTWPLRSASDTSPPARLASVNCGRGHGAVGGGRRPGGGEQRRGQQRRCGNPRIVFKCPPQKNAVSPSVASKVVRRLVAAQHVDVHDVVAHVEVHGQPVPDQHAGPGARRDREAVGAREPRGAGPERQVNGAVVGALTAEEYLAR